MRRRYKLLSWDYPNNSGLATDGTNYNGEPITFIVLGRDLDPAYNGFLNIGEVFTAQESHHRILFDVYVEEGPRSLASRVDEIVVKAAADLLPKPEPVLTTADQELIKTVEEDAKRAEGYRSTIPWEDTISPRFEYESNKDGVTASGGPVICEHANEVPFGCPGHCGCTCERCCIVQEDSVEAPNTYFIPPEITMALSEISRHAAKSIADLQRRVAELERRVAPGILPREVTPHEEGNATGRRRPNCY